LAQSTSPLANDPGAKVLGTFTVSTAVLDGGTTSDGKPLARAKAKPSNGQVTNEISVMRTSSGQINYMIDVNSIKLQDGAETWSTETIFNTLGAAAVVEGINRGYTSVGTKETTVWAYSCFERSYYSFTVLDTKNVSSRAYSINWDNTNGALVQLKSVSDPGCTGYNSIQ
jgi:hypothetical protein